MEAYNDGNVDVGSLLDSLSIGTGIGDDDQARLLERAGNVIGEVTRGEATSNGNSTGVGSELEDGTLSIGTSGDDADYSRNQNYASTSSSVLIFGNSKLGGGISAYCRPGCQWRR